MHVAAAVTVRRTSPCGPAAVTVRHASLCGPALAPPSLWPAPDRRHVPTSPSGSQV